MTTTHNLAASSAVLGHSKSSVSSVQMTFGSSLSEEWCLFRVRGSKQPARAAACD